MTSHQKDSSTTPADELTPEESYEVRLAAWEKARFAPPPEFPPTPIEPALVESVPMRDGVKLFTEVFLPRQTAASAEPVPVILFRTPYPSARGSRNGGKTISRYIAAGYAVVGQLTRGQGESEGTFHYYVDDIDDGYDAVQWIAEQPWCNGRVGMRGSSYSGNTQLLAARAKPPALKCIMPTAFVGNKTQCFPFSYGVPNKGSYMQWHQVLDAKEWDDMDVSYGDMNTALNHPKWGPAFRKQPLVDSADEVLSGDKLVAWRKAISNPMAPYWKSISFTDEELVELDIPMLMTDGWYDTTVGPIDFFSRLEKIQGDHADRFLLVGPWSHSQTAANSQPGEDNGDRVMPDNGAFDHVDMAITFFDRYLKEQQDVEVLKDRVKVYITGANRWIDLPTFPAPDTEFKPLYLHSQGDARTFPGDGQLTWESPTAEEPADLYTYDPDVPTASLVESFLDRRHTEIRSDVLSYTSEPLKQALTILGDIKLILHAASDAPDTDWFAIVSEVFPNGESKSFHYAPPAFRARYREGFDKEVFLTPNKPEAFCIPMGPAGHQIEAGNCIRLSIFSSAFPEYDPNTNTGNEAATDTDRQIAQQTIYHDALRPSHVILPITTLKP